jgi:hypothetical protein
MGTTKKVLQRRELLSARRRGIEGRRALKSQLRGTDASEELFTAARPHTEERKV